MKFKDLYLFDIDGTFVDLTDAHVNAYQKGYEEVFGEKISRESLVSKFGMAEIPMHNLICQENEIDYNSEQINSIISQWENGVLDYLKNNNLTPLIGVESLLKQIKEKEELLGVVTGNPEKLGSAFLQSSNLERFFSIFSWGDNAQNRNEITANAINQAKSQGYNEDSNLFVFGDSPYDIKAGNSFDAYTIGVATGHYSMDELNKAGANLVLENLLELDLIKLKNYIKN